MRETETKARGGGSGKKRKAASGGRISAEERASLLDAEDALGEAIGADVRVRKSGEGVKAEILADDVAELQSLAKRLGRRS